MVPPKENLKQPDCWIVAKAVYADGKEYRIGQHKGTGSLSCECPDARKSGKCPHKDAAEVILDKEVGK